jgi:Tfp pilus assembly protein PilW
MIAITITVLAMAAVYTTFIVQQRSFTTQDQVAETEVSSKIGFDMLVNDIRTAGFGYPDDEAPVVNTFTGAIRVTDSGPDLGPDTLTLVGGFRQIATLQNATTIGSNQIMINYTGSPQFNLINRSNLSIEGLTFATITNCTLIGGDCSGAAAITLDRDMTNAIPAGRPVYLVEDVTYRIAMDANGVNNLEKVWWINNTSTTDVLANNIDDLQAVAIDQDGDGDPDRLRISLLARTANEDQTLAPATKPYFAAGITLENNTTADTDRFRRRIWSMEVALRN